MLISSLKIQAAEGIVREILKLVDVCDSSVDCFFGAPCLQGGDKQNCPLVQLRNPIEEAIPAFSGKWREFSEYESVLRDSISAGPAGSEDLQELRSFLKVSIYGIVPFLFVDYNYDANYNRSFPSCAQASSSSTFRGNGLALKIPYLSSDFIREILEEKDISQQDNWQKLEEEIRAVDGQGFFYQQILSFFYNYCRFEKRNYTRRVWQLIQLVFEGVKRESIEFPKQDIEKLFTHINNEFLTHKL